MSSNLKISVVVLWLLLVANGIWFVSNRTTPPAPARQPNPAAIFQPAEEDSIPYPCKVPPPDFKFLVLVHKDVKVKDYYAFIDSMAAAYPVNSRCELNEYILVHHNAWIMDTLASFDYYERMRKGEFIYDQREMVVIRKGSLLFIPTESRADSIAAMLANTVLDLNIPEFKLRIMVNGVPKYIFPVRVGRDEKKYLAMAGREVSLKTPIGKGEIVRIVRDPLFINPVDNKRYYGTNRDDKRYTKLPLIPWLEPTIDGRRQGSLIHPTTNEATLGKPYSNACVGTPEGAAWIIYYHAPLGTKVNFRYDLKVADDNGDTIILKDIYQLRKPI